LDLSRKRLDWLAVDEQGQLAANGAVATFPMVRTATLRSGHA
jgi:hypothetical protein